MARLLSFPAFCKQFKAYFGVWNQKFLDAQLTTLKREGIYVDLMAFDDWLHQKFGEYEEQNKSMSDIINEKFGKEAGFFITDHI